MSEVWSCVVKISNIFPEAEQLKTDQSVYINRLKKDSVKVEEKTLNNVATISANNDEFVGNIISDTYNIVGENGIVTVEKSQNSETYSETTEGIKIESDSQTTISRSQEGPGNNHAFLTLSYHLSGSLGGFQMYTYSYYSDINFRIQNNDTHGGRNHNDMAFIRSGSTVGSVSISTSGTSFNTSSDYRLKEDHKSITDAIGTVKQLKPINFKWKKTN